jgi:hypothetical protein
MASKKSDPDHLLAREQLPELNKFFYAGKPWEHFNYRNHLLMLVAGAGDRLYEIAREGVTYKGLFYQEKSEEGEEGEEEEAAQARERFIIADSEALLHHAIETLLRLYLAHEDQDPCPWLEMARIRTPGAFKQKVEARFLADMPQDERRERTAKVFFGTADRTKLKPMPSEEDWNSGLDNIEAFLGHFAQHFSDADVYSALKHGLAVRPGEAAFQLGDGQLIKAEGPSIEYLGLRLNPDGERRWHRSVSWIRPEHSMGLVFLAARLMESLWGIAKFRYLGEKPEALNLWTKPVYQEVTERISEGEDAGVFVDTMHMELLYYGDPEAEDPPEQAAA